MKTPLWKDVALVVGGSALLFLALLSRDYIGDGVRWLPVMTGPGLPRPGDANHFLFPLLGWGAWRLAVGSGFSTLLASLSSRSPALVFFQGLNACLGAMGLGALHLLLRWSGVSRRSTWLAVGLTGLSHAYLLHATDMTEPMSSVPWMLLGAALVRRSPESRGARWGGGVLIGLAGSFYLTALGVCSLLACSVGLRFLRQRQPVRGLLAVAEVGVASVASFVVLLLSVRYAFVAVHGPGEELNSLTKLPTGSGLFGVVDPRHLVGAYFGFANAFAPLRDWEGASLLLRAAPGVLAYNLAVVAVFTLFLVALGRALRTAGVGFLRSERFPDAVGALVWTGGTYLLASFWSATYEKLWIGGVLGTALFLAVLLDASGPRERASRPAVLLAPLALLLLVSLLGGGVSRRVRTNEDLSEAIELSKHLQASDLVICDGWDMPSVYLSRVIEPPLPCWRVVDEMIGTGLNAETFAAKLQREIDQAHAAKRRVFFLGLLGLSEAEWKPFLGERLRLPYSVLAPYRSRAVVVMKVRGKKGVEQTLYRDCAGAGDGCPLGALSGPSVP